MSELPSQTAEKALLDSIRGDEDKIDAPVLRGLVAIAVEVDRANAGIKRVAEDQRSANNRQLAAWGSILLAVIAAIIQQAVS